MFEFSKAKWAQSYNYHASRPHQKHSHFPLSGGYSTHSIPWTSSLAWLWDFYEVQIRIATKGHGSIFDLPALEFRQAVSVSATNKFQVKVIVALCTLEALVPIYIDHLVYVYAWTGRQGNSKNKCCILILLLFRSILNDGIHATHIFFHYLSPKEYRKKLSEHNS